MANFEVKIKRTVIDPKSGNDKNITETFFVENAVNFGDAETRVETYWNCECEVIGVAISKAMEVLNYPTQEEKMDMRVYRAILIATFTDDNGEPKESKYPIILWAKGVEDAMAQVKEYILHGYGEDMVLASIVRTKIVEVI